MSTKTPHLSGPGRVVALVADGSGGPKAVHDLPEAEALIVPGDAGKYRDALITVLLRIPTGYDKRISCGPGWYRIVAQLHKELCEIDVHYTVYSVRRCENRLQYEAESGAEDPAVQRSFREAITRAQLRSSVVCPWSGEPLRKL